MRLFFASLCAALLLALPYIALHNDMDFPFAGATMLPMTALHHLANSVHELGHALSRWLFGYPAFPALDAIRGGGYTVYGDRSFALLWIVWCAFAASIVFCKKTGRQRAVPSLYGAFIVHIILALDPFHEAFILYMGHGAEIALACGLCLLAARKEKWRFFWRAAAMASGMYIALKNTIMCLLLLGGRAAQLGHAVAHGGKGAGDFDRIAEIAWWGREAAVLSFIFIIAASLALTWLAAARRGRAWLKPETKLRAEAQLLVAAQRPWKFFAVSLAFMTVAALPYAVHQFESDLPLWSLVALMPLSEGLHYMNVMVHEPGHALTYWIFGTPAFALIDAVKGGGVTYNFGRSHALLAGIYVLMAAGGMLLARKGNWAGATWLAAFAATHVLFVWRGWDVTLAACMGHIFEVVWGCYFVLLALDRQAQQSLAERYTAMIFGLYLCAHTGLLCLALLLVDARRLSYGMQKGVPGSADLDKAAEYMGISIEAAAACMGLFLLAAIFATLFILHKRRISGRR